MSEKIINFFKKDTVYFKDKEKIIRDLCESLGKTYYSLTFEKSCHFSSTPDTHIYKWRIYIDGYGGFNGEKFNETLNEFKEKFNITEKTTQNLIL